MSNRLTLETDVTDADGVSFRAECIFRVVEGSDAHGVRAERWAVLDSVEPVEDSVDILADLSQSERSRLEGLADDKLAEAPLNFGTWGAR